MPSVRSNLRERIQRGETIVAPGAYDPLSARVVQALGFTTVYTGGYMTGAHTSITEHRRPGLSQACLLPQGFGAHRPHAGICGAYDLRPESAP